MKSTKETENCNRKNANVYSYARWSSGAQGDGDSKRRQSQLALDWCVRRGLSLSGQEKDDGVSAWKGKNQREGSGLSRLLKLVKRGDYLLVEDNDRLSRQDWLTAMNFLAEIVERGVIVVTLADGNEIDAERFRNDPGCFLPALLRAHLGHDENEKKSERIKASWEARKQRMSDGKAANLHLPCWLAWDDDVDKPVLVENNATVIRKMFSLALEGLGCHTIARTLHREGYKLVVEGKRRERTLTISAPYVWRILRNKLAIGYGIYVDPPQPGVYPAVVDEPTFYAVQKLLRENKHQTAPRAHSTSSLVTGIAHCSKCRGTLCRFTQCRNGKTYQYLVCSDTLHKHGKCGMASIRYDAFEKSFLHLLSQSDLVRQAMGEATPAAPALLDSLCGQQAECDNQVIKLMTLIKGDPNPSHAVYTAIKEAEAKSAGLRQQIEVERGRLKAETPGLEDYEEFCERFAGRMEHKEYRDEVKALLRGFVLRIDVELGHDVYHVQFKGAAQPITVTLHQKDGWLFSPAPRWALGDQVPEGGNVIG